MTPEQYAAELRRISGSLAQYVRVIARLFRGTDLTFGQWVDLLKVVYPEVERQRYEAAAVARRFYDSQRVVEHPHLPRNDRPLEGYRFEWFVENMEPVRKRMSQMDSDADAVSHMALQAIREVENAGRRQIIHAVQNDPEPQIVKGWARVATGRETCAWCLMLVSRGPVYMAADTAGLDLHEETAEEMIAAGEDVSPYMNQWHTGCDCKVVPVYDYKNWPGKDAAARALEMWNDATDEARGLIESGKSRTSNLNREAINALRRRLSRGEINTFEFAALAA